jgi:hypothetical protein
MAHIIATHHIITKNDKGEITRWVGAESLQQAKRLVKQWARLYGNAEIKDAPKRS